MLDTVTRICLPLGKLEITDKEQKDSGNAMMIDEKIRSRDRLSRSMQTTLRLVDAVMSKPLRQASSQEQRKARETALLACLPQSSRSALSRSPNCRFLHLLQHPVIGTLAHFRQQDALHQNFSICFSFGSTCVPEPQPLPISPLSIDDDLSRAGIRLHVQIDMETEIMNLALTVASQRRAMRGYCRAVRLCRALCLCDVSMSSMQNLSRFQARRQRCLALLGAARLAASIAALRTRTVFNFKQ